MTSYILLILAALCVAFVASQNFEDTPSKLSYATNFEDDSDESDEYDESDESDESEEQALRSDQRANSAEANELADQFVRDMNFQMLVLGKDPVELPDAINKFSWRILLITYYGELSYTKGWLQGLSSAERRSDASIRTDGQDTILSMPLRYTVLQFSYDYVSQFMGLGPKGGIDGRVTKTKFTIEIRMDPQNHTTMETFKLKKLGRTSIKFTGNILTDWLANIFTAVTIPFIKPIIYNALYDTIEESVQQVIEERNN